MRLRADEETDRSIRHGRRFGITASTTLSWRVMFFAVGLIGTLTVMLLWLHLPEDQPHEEAASCAS